MTNISTSSLSSLSDLDLIQEVKINNNSTAISILTDRHSGVYHTIANQYKFNPYVCYPDVIKNKDFVVWQAAIKYDAGKGSFANLVANMARYECYSMINESKKYRVNQRAGLEDAAELPQENDKGELTHMVSYIEEILPDDPKTKKIIMDRFVNGGAKPTPWREVAKKNGMSHWGCVLRARDAIKEIQGKMRSEFRDLPKID